MERSDPDVPARELCSDSDGPDDRRLTMEPLDEVAEVQSVMRELLTSDAGWLDLSRWNAPWEAVLMLIQLQYE